MSDVVDRLKGSMPALVTPLTPGLKADREGIGRLVEYTLRGGVDGMVVLGSSGEFQGIPWGERRAVITAVVEAVDGKVPVIVGAGLPNLQATIEQIAEAADCGADASLVTPPYYFPIGQDAIVAWFENLVANSSVPILYYHFPGMTKLSAEPGTVVRLRDSGVVGIKDSGGATAYLQQVLYLLESDADFKVFVGGDTHYLSALVHGADGTIGLQPNVIPHIDAGIYDAFQRRDLETAAELQREAADFLNALGPSGGQGQPYAKAILEKLGICGRTVAPPMRALGDREADALWERVERYVFKPAVVA